MMDAYLLIKYLKCATTPKEEAIVQAWLANDPDGSHMKQYKEAHDIFNGMTIYGDSEPVKEKKLSSVRKVLLVAMRVAVAVTILFGVGLWVRNDTLDGISERTKRITIPAGKSLCMTLEDGTTMWLNAGSDVEYPLAFSRKERRVKVNAGEVLFDVKHEAERPFYVDNYAAEIAVHGTKFNVKVDQKNNLFSTALIHGCVEVTSHGDDNQKFILEPDNIIELVDNKLRISSVEDATQFACWTDGLINVSGVPFDELMRTFELAFDVDIDILRKDIPEIMFTRGKIRVSDGLEHALNILRFASEFDYERNYEKNKVVIN